MVARIEDIEKYPYWPRMLSAEQAAAYTGVSVTTFLWEVRQGKWPPPEPRGRKGDRMTWDRFLIDARQNLRSGIRPGNPAGTMSLDPEALALARLGG
jgi:hypothetical protein